MADNKGLNPETGLVDEATDPVVDTFRNLLKVKANNSQNSGTSRDQLGQWSKYDSGASPFMSETSQRGDVQPISHKITNGILKAGATIGSMATFGLAGIAESTIRLFNPSETMGEAFRGDNNYMFAISDSINEYMQENFPNYQSSYEQQKHFLGTAIPFTEGSANFWFNDVLGGAAFTIGAVLQESIVASLVAGTGGFAAPVQGAMAARLGVMLPKVISNTARASKVLKSGAVNFAKTSKALGQGATMLRQLATGAYFEAGVETRELGRQIEQQEVNKITQTYPEYKGMTLSQIAEVNPDVAKGALDKKIEIMNGAMAANIALISIGNATTLGKIFTYGRVGNRILNNTANIKAVNSLSNTVKKNLGDTIKNNQFIQAYKTYSKTGRRALAMKEALKPIIAEGFIEEGGQSLISASGLNYVSQKYSKEGVEDQYDLYESIVKGLTDKFGSGGDGWKEVFIGAIIGAGSTAIQNKFVGKRTLGDTFLGNWADIKEQQDNAANKLNGLNLENLQINLQSGIRASQISKDITNAELKSDYIAAEIAEHNQFFNYAASRLRTGYGDHLYLDIQDQVKNIETVEDYVNLTGDTSVNESNLDQKKSQLEESMFKAVDNISEHLKRAYDLAPQQSLDYQEALAFSMSKIDQLDQVEAELGKKLDVTLKQFSIDLNYKDPDTKTDIKPYARNYEKYKNAFSIPEVKEFFKRNPYLIPDFKKNLRELKKVSGLREAAIWEFNNLNTVKGKVDFQEDIDSFLRELEKTYVRTEQDNVAKTLASDNDIKTKKDFTKKLTTLRYNEDTFQGLKDLLDKANSDVDNTEEKEELLNKTKEELQILFSNTEDEELKEQIKEQIDAIDENVKTIADINKESSKVEKKEDKKTGNIFESYVGLNMANTKYSNNKNILREITQDKSAFSRIELIVDISQIDKAQDTISIANNSVIRKGGITEGPNKGGRLNIVYTHTDGAEYILGHLEDPNRFYKDGKPLNPSNPTDLKLINSSFVNDGLVTTKGKKFQTYHTEHSKLWERIYNGDKNIDNVDLRELFYIAPSESFTLHKNLNLQEAPSIEDYFDDKPEYHVEINGRKGILMYSSLKGTGEAFYFRVNGKNEQLKGKDETVANSLRNKIIENSDIYKIDDNDNRLYLKVRGQYIKQENNQVILKSLNNDSLLITSKQPLIEADSIEDSNFVTDIKSQIELYNKKIEDNKVSSEKGNSDYNGVTINGRSDQSMFFTSSGQSGNVDFSLRVKVKRKKGSKEQPDGVMLEMLGYIYNGDHGSGFHRIPIWLNADGTKIKYSKTEIDITTTNIIKAANQMISAQKFRGNLPIALNNAKIHNVRKRVIENPGNAFKVTANKVPSLNLKFTPKKDYVVKDTKSFTSDQMKQAKEYIDGFKGDNQSLTDLSMTLLERKNLGGIIVSRKDIPTLNKYILSLKTSKKPSEKKSKRKRLNPNIKLPALKKKKETKPKEQKEDKNKQTRSVVKEWLDTIIEVETNLTMELELEDFYTPTLSAVFEYYNIDKNYTLENVSKAQELLTKEYSSFKNNKGDTVFSMATQEESISFEKAKSNIERILGDNVSVERIENMLNSFDLNGVPTAAYSAGVIYLHEQTSFNAEYHEAFHHVYRALLTKAERKSLHNATKKLYGKPNTRDYQRLKDINPNMTYELWYEEKLAEDFANYKVKNKKPKSSVIRRIFDSLINLLKNFFSNRARLESFYEKIYNGEFKNADIKNYNFDDAFSLKDILRDGDNNIILTKYISPIETNKLVNTIARNLVNNIDLNDNIIRTEISKLAESYNYLNWKEQFKELISKDERSKITPLRKLLDRRNRILSDTDNIPYIVDKVRFALELYDSADDAAIMNEEGTSFDKSPMEIGGYSSLSNTMKKYISFIPYIENTFNLEYNDKFLLSADTTTIYNILSRSLADTSKEDMLSKIYHIAQDNDHIEAFFNFLINDINNDLGTELSAEDVILLPYNVLNNSQKFNMVTNNFHKSKTLYMTVILDPNNGGLKVFNANQKNVSKIQFERWRNSFYDNIGRLDPNKAVGVFKKTLKEIESRIQGFETLESLERDIDFIRSKFLSLGIDLSRSYIKFNIALANINTLVNLESAEELISFYNSFEDTVTPFVELDERSGNYNMRSLHAIEAPNSEFGLLTEDNQSRWFKIASSNSIFDNTVGGSTFQNAEGKTIYDKIAYSYITSEIQNWKGRRELVRKINNNEDIIQYLIDSEYVTNEYDAQMLSEILKNNPLMLGIHRPKNKDGQLLDITQSLDYTLTVIDNWQSIMADGIEQNNLDADGNVMKYGSSRKKASSFKHSDQRSKLLLNLSLFADSSSTYNKIASKIDSRLFNVSVNAEKATNNLLQLPIHSFYDKGKPTEIAREWVKNFIQQEVNRIKRVKTEYKEGNIKGYNKFDEQIENLLDGEKYSDVYDILLERRLNNPKGANFTGLDLFHFDTLEDAKDIVLAALKGDDITFNNETLDNFLNSLVDNYINLINELEMQDVIPNHYKTDNKLNRDKIAEFVLNDYLNTMAFTNLTDGDYTMMYKNPTDVIKRNSGKVATGSDLGPLKSNMAIVASFEDFIEPEETDRHGVKAVRGEDKSIDRSDAQMYSTVDYYINKYLKNTSKYNRSIEDIYKKIKRGIAISKKENDRLLSINADMRPRKLVYRDMTNYVKMSSLAIGRGLVSVPTISTEELNRLWDSYDQSKDKSLLDRIHNSYRAIPGRERLHNLLNQMERSDTNIVAMDSAIKTAKKSVGKYEDNKWTLTNQVIADSNMLEQVITDADKTSITHGTQQMGLITSEHNHSQSVNYPSTGIKSNIGQAITDYDKLLGKRVENGLADKNDLLYIIENNLVQEPLYKYLHNKFISTLKLSTPDPYLLELFELDEYGKPIYNWNYSAVVKKFEAMYLSLVSKDTLKQKSAGRKYTLASDQGISVLRNNKKEIVPASKYIDGMEVTSSRLRHRIKDSDGNYYSEVMVSRSALDKFKIGDTVNIPTHIAHQFGIRIPTQDKHSMVTIKIVDVLPYEYGNIVVMPYEIVLLSGADFDIDSLYARVYENYTLGDTTIKYGSYRNYKNPYTAALQEYKTYNINNNWKVKQKISELKTNHKDDINRLQSQKTVLYNEITNSIKVRKGLDSLETQLLESKLDVLDIFSSPDNYIESEVLSEIEGLLNEENIKIKDLKDKVSDISNIELEIRESLQSEAFKSLRLPYTLSEFKNEFGDRVDANLLATNYSDIVPITKAELNNMLLDLEIVLTHNDSNKEVAATPTSFKMFDKALDHLKDVIETDSINGLVHDAASKSVMSNSIDIGGQGIGPVAKANVAFQLLHAYGIKLGFDVDGNQIKVLGKSSFRQNVDSNGKILNDKGERINDLLSGLLSAMTDNAKEQLAKEFNLSTDTLGPALTMLMLGHDFTYVMTLMKQPIIEEFMKASQISSSSIKTKAENKRYKKEFSNIDKLMKPIINNYQTSTNLKIEDLTLDRLTTSLKETDNAVQVLVAEEFMKAFSISINTIHLGKITGLTKGLPSTWSEVDDIKNSITKLGLSLNGNRFNNTNITQVKESPLLTGLDKLFKDNKHLNSSIRALNDISNRSGEFFITNTNQFKTILSKIKNGLKPEAFDYYVNNDIISKELVNFLQVRAFLNMRNLNLNTDLLFSSKLHDDLSDLRSDPELTNNKFLKFLKLNIIPASDKGIYKGKTLYTLEGDTRTKIHPDYTEQLISDFIELTNYNNKSFEFTNNIIAYILLKDNMQYKNNGIVKQIPPSTIKNIMKAGQVVHNLMLDKDFVNFNGDKVDGLNQDKAYQEIFGLDKSEIISQFTEIFSRNTTYTANFVKFAVKGALNKYPVDFNSDNSAFIIDLTKKHTRSISSKDSKGKKLSHFKENVKQLKETGIFSINGESQLEYPLLINIKIASGQTKLFKRDQSNDILHSAEIVSYSEVNRIGMVNLFHPNALTPNQHNELISKETQKKDVEEEKKLVFEDTDDTVIEEKVSTRARVKSNAKLPKLKQLGNTSNIAFNINKESILDEMLAHLKDKFNIDFEYDYALNYKGTYISSSNKIIVNPTLADLTTPFHEFAHPFIIGLRKENPKLYRQLIREVNSDKEFMSNLDLKYRQTFLDDFNNFIKEGDINTYIKDRLNEEAIVTKLGEYASNKYMSRKTKSLLDKFIDWLRNLLGIDINADSKLQEISKMFLDKNKINLSNVDSQFNYLQLANNNQNLQYQTQINSNTPIIQKRALERALQMDQRVVLADGKYILDNNKQLERVSNILNQQPRFKFTGDESLYEDNRQWGNDLDTVLTGVILNHSLDDIKLKVQLLSDDVINKAYNGFKEFVSNERAKGNVLLTQIKTFNEELGIAGTVDILVIQPDGDIRIIDLKSSINKTAYNAETGKFESFEKTAQSGQEYTTSYDKKFDNSASTKEKHQAQQSMYRGMLEAQGFLTDPFVNISILPIHVKEEASDIEFENMFNLETLKEFYSKLKVDSLNTIDNSPDDSYATFIEKIKINLQNRIIELKSKNKRGQTERINRLIQDINSIETIGALNNYISNIHTQIFGDGANWAGFLRIYESYNNKVANGTYDNSLEMLNNIQDLYNSLTNIKENDVLEQLIRSFKKMDLKTLKDDTNPYKKLLEINDSLLDIKDTYEKNIPKLQAKILAETGSEQFKKKRLARIKALDKRRKTYSLDSKRYNSLTNKLKKDFNVTFDNNDNPVFVSDAESIIYDAITTNAYSEIPWIDMMITPAISSSNEIISNFAKLVKDKFTDARLKSLKFLDKANSFYREYINILPSANSYSSINEGLYEKVEFVKKDGVKYDKMSFVQMIDYTRFNKAKAKMFESLEDINDSQERRRIISDWYKNNTQDRPENDIKIAGAVIIEGTETIKKRMKRELKGADYTYWLNSVDTKRGFRNEFVIPDLTIYENSKFRELFPTNKVTNAKQKYYVNLLESYFKAQENYPGRSSDIARFFLPSIPKKSWERNIEGKSIKDRLNNIKYSLEESIKYKEEDINIYGDPDTKTVPLLYQYNMKSEDVSLDLVNSIIQFTHASNKYVAQLEVEPLAQSLLGVTSKENPIAISDGNKVLSRFKNKLGLTTSAKYKKSKTNNVHTLLESFINHHVYGETKIKEEVSLLGKKFDLHKMSALITKYASITQIGGLRLTNFANSLQANVMLALEGVASEYISLKSWGEAQAIYAQNIHTFAKNQYIDNRPKSKLNKLIELYDVLQDETFSRSASRISRSKLMRGLSMETYFSPQSMGEHHVATVSMISLLKDKKITIEGETLTMWDAYNKYGLDKVPFDKELMNKMHAMNKRLHGVYSSFDKPHIERFWYGNLVMMYRKFLVPGFKKRFKAEGYDAELGDYTYGSYRNFTRLLIDDAGKLLSYLSPLNTTEHYTTQERANIRRTVAELLTIFGLGMLLMALEGMGDDDKKKKWHQYSVYFSLRLISEMKTYGMIGDPSMGPISAFLPDINSIFRMTMTPTIAETSIEKWFKLIQQASSDPFEQYKRNTGPYKKGDLKLEARFNQILGYNGRLFHPDEANKILKLYTR